MSPKKSQILSCDTVVANERYDLMLRKAVLVVKHCCIKGSRLMAPHLQLIVTVEMSVSCSVKLYLF